MAFSWSTSSIQQIRLIVPRYGPAINPNKISRRSGGGNNQRRGNPRVFTDANSSKDWWEPTRKELIKIHRLISGNAASVPSNLGRGQHWHLVLAMTSVEYMEQTGLAFVPPHNPDDYSQSMGSAQKQSLGTEKFRQNQGLLWKYNAVERALKK